MYGSYYFETMAVRLPVGIVTDDPAGTNLPEGPCGIATVLALDAGPRWLREAAVVEARQRLARGPGLRRSLPSALA